MTGKEKRYLRSLAVNMHPITQIGKEGLTDNIIEVILINLEAHELCKISMLETNPDSLDEIENKLSLNEIELVQKIGNQLVLYKLNPKLKEHLL